MGVNLLIKAQWTYWNAALHMSHNIAQHNGRQQREQVNLSNRTLYNKTTKTKRRSIHIIQIAQNRQRFLSQVSVWLWATPWKLPSADQIGCKKTVIPTFSVECTAF